MAAAEYSGDDDALFVLTAALLTPGQFPGVLGDDYPAACAELDLPPLDAGYGLVFGQDGDGARWTVATTDTAMVACALAAWDCGLEYDLSPDEDTMAASLPGWPVPVAVAVPGVPDPHDPDEEIGGGPALSPPDTSAWGPAQRRLGADEIAANWWAWRDQLTGVPADTDAAPTAQEGAPDAGPAAREETGETATDAAAPPAAPRPGSDTGAPAPAPAPATDDAPNSAETPSAPDGAETPAPTPVRAPDPGSDPAAGQPRKPDDAPPPAITHGGVRQVLAAAEEYLSTPPPPGRVRTAYGAVRADGPGWSMVGRTDDMAFVLLDDAPGEVLPVGRGPALPPLLEALTRLAVDPQRAPAVSPA